MYVNCFGVINLKAKIFYFSGTGNSLAVARQIAKGIGTNNVINIVDVVEHELKLCEEVVGFVFPVYFQDIPGIVKEFISKIEFKNNSYVFGIATCNDVPGVTLYNLDKILRSKGQKLSAGFELTMPGNSIIIIDFTSSLELQKERLDDSKIEIEKITKIIKNQYKSEVEGKMNIKNLLEGWTTKFFATKIYKAHKKFTVNGKCNRCGTCQKICPKTNIKMGEQISWGNNCVLCLACFHWCPQNGIEMGNTENKIRYHHPDIKVRDMVLR